MTASSETLAPPPAAEAGPHRRPTTATRTERNWLFSAAILVGGVALFAVARAVEVGLGRWDGSLRLVLEPAETFMVYVGISHFLVAILYLSTSSRMRSGRAWVRLAGLLALGTILCVGFGGLRRANPILAGVLFFGYFLVHDFRDQVFFSFANGDEPAARPGSALAATLLYPPFLAIGAVGLLLAAAVVAGVPGSEPFSIAFGRMPPGARWALVLVLAGVLGAAAWRFRAQIRDAGFSSAAAFLRRHRPVFVVFGGSLALLGTGIALGWRGYSIVILHVASWYVFSLTQLRKAARSGAPRPAGWARVRQTAAGFNLVHVGSVALLLVAGVVWAYVFRNDPSRTAFSVLLDRDNFQYWTILHVTSSFASR